MTKNNFFKRCACLDDNLISSPHICMKLYKWVHYIDVWKFICLFWPRKYVQRYLPIFLPTAFGGIAFTHGIWIDRQTVG